MNQGKHYYCPSCGGVDTTEHTCRTPNCPREGQPLLEHEGDETSDHTKETPAGKGSLPPNE